MPRAATRSRECRDIYHDEVTEPLIVLEIDTDLLDAEVRDDQVGDDIFPHIYGPIPPSRGRLASHPPSPIELGTSRTPAGPPRR